MFTAHQSSEMHGGRSLVRSLSAILLIVVGASTSEAASNYRPVDQNSYRAGPMEDDEPFAAPGPARGIDRSSRYDLSDELPPTRMRSQPLHSQFRNLEDDVDSFGIIAPRRRDKVPWSRSPYSAPSRFDSDDAPPFDRYPRRGYDEGFDRGPDRPQRMDRMPGFGRQSPSFDEADSPYNFGPSRPVMAPQRPRQPVRTHTDGQPDPQDLISRRYQDPAVLRMIGSLSPQQVLSMYGETLQLIQNRHLSPPAPQALVQRGVMNLVQALQNPAFQQANQMGYMPQQAQGFMQGLSTQLQQMRIASAEDAVGALQMAMQMASQQLHLSPVVVGLEFEYGAIESLDRFSAFVPPETARVTNQQLGEAVVGIGVQIERADQGVRISKVLPEGPASQSGLQAGDLIVMVDGESITGGDLDAATSRITGREGSTVTLGLLRNGRQSQVALPRRSVSVHSVTDVQMIDPSDRIGYMKLETFASNSKQEMEQALWTLHQQGMKSLILDLRGDPGGLLTAAVEIADLFLPDGTIVSTRGRNASDNTTETATAPETWRVPLVVLVDENSASASEIFAAAIQENGRGTIVGRHTYGKGTVQTLFPLQSASAGLRLTTAKFYSPTGREMAGAGVEPDVAVDEEGLATNRGPGMDGDIQAAIEVARGGAEGPDQYRGSRQLIGSRTPRFGR